VTLLLVARGHQPRQNSKPHLTDCTGELRSCYKGQSVFAIRFVTGTSITVGHRQGAFTENGDILGVISDNVRGRTLSNSGFLPMAMLATVCKISLGRVRLDVEHGLPPFARSSAVRTLSRDFP
jgi:hypothetical protein